MSVNASLEPKTTQIGILHSIQLVGRGLDSRIMGLGFVSSVRRGLLSSSPSQEWL